ncbi:SNF2 family N-terminal domain-containing protein [Podospora australis]|uniref:SNF2 family N-terminal domain-containing protein n=1 Tax=Podospora australis TaxID=1536484 RepID=A0AAN6WIV9_9PEZI|nr:SNF2 family N-terminal domain-containing protein [Podospora australis]
MPSSPFVAQKDAKLVPVKVQPFGDMLKLTYQDTDSYAGVISNSVLSESEPKQKADKLNSSSTIERQVRIVILGLSQDSSVVGDLLSDANLFLQHPSATELPTRVSYHNPHYLLRPGAQIPDLEDLPLADDERTDSAKQGPRTKWKGNAGVIDGAQFPTLWVPAASEPQGYRHVIIGARKTKVPPVSGGVLADDMGLGKTLTVLALICSSLDDGPAESSRQLGSRGLLGTLIVCPNSSVRKAKLYLLYVANFVRHIRPGNVKSVVYHGSNRAKLKPHLQEYDVVLTTYGTLRAEWTRVRKGLYTPTLAAHHIRRRTSQLFRAASAIRAQYRWCLTGTPIHNSIDDYGALLSFIGVDGFRDKKEFDYWIANPTANKSPLGIPRLQSLMRATCLRRSKSSSVISQSLRLTKPTERIEPVTLTKRKGKGEGNSNRRVTNKTDDNILSLMSVPRLICNHGKDLLPPSARAAWASGSHESECDASLDGNEAEDIPMRTQTLNRDYGKQPSAKIKSLLSNLKYEQLWSVNGELPVRSVIFSYWTKMLDLVEPVLTSNGFTVARIDGQAGLGARSAALKEFSNNPKCTIMLASIGSCGEGVDFTAASNVHLLESQWNPMAETQAIDRVNRKEQTRPVTVTRSELMHQHLWGQV